MVDLPRLLLAAPASGSGKTTVTIGLLELLRRAGMHPAAFKCGPDYIDPLFHQQVLGLSGGNVDLFFTPPDLACSLITQQATGSGIAVFEGVMGYYDGIGTSFKASSWHLATVTRTPAVLIVNARGASVSLAALVRGFSQFKPDSRIAGIVLNRCSSTLHDRLAPMLTGETGLPVLGHIAELPDAHLESRHLGLVTPDQIADLKNKITILADSMAETVDFQALIQLAKTAPAMSEKNTAHIHPAVPAPVRIAVANDPAFCFYYRENFSLLEQLGAQLEFFSPLTDAQLPERIGGVYIGGGYPELFASRLSANHSMRESIRTAIANSLPTVAECGGFMYLQNSLADQTGTLHPMVGALPGMCKNTGRLGRFGYCTLEAREDSLLCDKGESIRAHEFHYWDSDTPGSAFHAAKAGGTRGWECVQAGPSLFAGFPHLSFWSNPECARRFVRAAAAYAGKTIQ